MTDAEILALWDSEVPNVTPFPADTLAFARALIAATREEDVGGGFHWIARTGEQIKGPACLELRGPDGQLVMKFALRPGWIKRIYVEIADLADEDINPLREQHTPRGK